MEELKKQINKLYKEKKYEDAFNLLETIKDDFLKDFNLLKIKVSLLGLLGKYEDAISLSDVALQISSDDYIVLHIKGVSLLHLKRYSESLNVFNQCLDIAPHFYQATEKKIHALLGLGRFEDAAQLYQESDLPAIDHEIPFNNLGYTYIQLGDLEKARDFLQKAQKFNKYHASIYYNFAHIAVKVGDKRGYFKNIVLFGLLKFLDLIGFSKILRKFTPSNKFQEKRQIFDGPGKLFKTKSEEKEIKAILKLLRTPNAMALCNEWWDWIGVNLPYNAVHKNSFGGDIDILIRRPNNIDGQKLDFATRAFEVKTTKVDKNGKNNWREASRHWKT